MLFGFVLLVMLVFLIWHSHQCDEALRALNAECDTGNAFVEWRLRNQGVHIGLSEEGRMLLGRWLEAYDWFLRTHKFIDGREKREWLVRMFYDFPPKHPDGIPSVPPRPKDAAKLLKPLLTIP